MRTYHKRNLALVLVIVILATVLLVGRLAYLMIVKAEHYGILAKEIHERERPVKAKRGIIYDANLNEIASNKPVCTVSVIHSQIEEPERVIQVISQELEISEEKVRKRVEKISSIERIQSNVEKEVADRLRTYHLAGVMIDEDYKRYYPYQSLASKVIGFTGSDNQGIIGLEVKYDEYLQGINGKILTLTTASGVEIDGAAENRMEPIAGNDLYTSLDINIQMYAEQVAKKVKEAKSARAVTIIVMNPKNGEIMAMVNVPEFDLNHPYELNTLTAEAPLQESEKMKVLNEIWRNDAISDTYEPGSVFKIITATAALENGEVRLDDPFHCPGYRIVEDRRIRCHKVIGHGSQTFVDGIKNSCNPVFMEIGSRVGAKRMYACFDKLGLFEKTGVDLPGEAGSIMHQIENIGEVELATVSFGQSFQITPMQLITAVSAVINGGNGITPHIGVKLYNKETNTVKELEYEEKKNVVSEETSATMRSLLEAVVAEGTGKRAYLEGLRIGGKTATSEKLPRSSNKYISSFLGFAPANNPEVVALILIDEPEGIYYGGTIAAPVIGELFSNILPYLGLDSI